MPASSARAAIITAWRRVFIHRCDGLVAPARNAHVRSHGRPRRAACGIAASGARPRGAAGPPSSILSAVAAGPRRPAPDGFAGVGAAVLDALPISLYVVDRALRIVFWNRERERGAHGRPRDEVLGRPLSHALAPAGYRATAPLIRRIFATGRPQEETRETQG